MRYLHFEDMDPVALNQRGLGKLLLLRRQVIHLKNVMRWASREPPLLTAFLEEAGLSWPRYLRLLTHRVRASLKARRTLQSMDLTALGGDCPVRLCQATGVGALVAVDFDRTLTDRGFVAWFRREVLAHPDVFRAHVVSAHGRAEVIRAFLDKHRLELARHRVLACGGVGAKSRALFRLANTPERPILLHFDDELEMCRLAQLLGYHSFLVAGGSAQRVPLPDLRSRGRRPEETGGRPPGHDR
ncbi:MAG: hypothetical protein AB1758_38070 [Candidatus Eremiobacterota bacterium]